MAYQKIFLDIFDNLVNNNIDADLLNDNNSVNSNINIDIKIKPNPDENIIGKYNNDLYKNNSVINTKELF